MRRLQLNPAISHRGIFILFLAIALAICSVVTGMGATAPPQVTIVFRYDDFSSRSATDLEEKILQVFQEHRACCTFSIIPFVKAVDYLDTSPQAVVPLTAVKAELARKAIAAGTMDAAQHGYSHQKQSYARHWCTEFEGLDYDCQFDKIEKGKVFLEKILDAEVTTFVPPFNSYDANTLKVLEQLNFQCLSASLHGQTVPSTSLRILPETCNLAHLRDVIHYARKIADYHPIICVMFHQYDFIGIDDTKEAERNVPKTSLKEFNELLSWISAQEDIRIRSITQLLEEHIDLSMKRFIKNKYYLELTHLKPAWWPPHYGLYLPVHTAFNLRMKNILSNLTLPHIRNIFFVSLFYLLILIIFFAISYILTLLFIALAKYIDKIFKYLSLILLGFLIFYLISTTKIEYKRLEILVAALGISLGLWLGGSRWKKSGAAKVRG